MEFYRNFCFIIENNNGDIVVFDFGSVVVVIDYEGKDCFFYIGFLLRFWLEFRGICIDLLLNIFVCDNVFELVYVIDKDG